MFGYVVANQKTLDEVQIARYRECYCGLCRTLKERYGQLSRFCLTYDMTFLVLLLDSLHEPDISAGRKRCMVHITPQLWRKSQWTDYAADMNVALAYYNCLDDWQDDKNPLAYLYAKQLEHAYQDIKTRWPEQCACIEVSLQQLSELEQANSPDLDAAAGCFGRLMGTLFAVGDSFWHKALYQIGDSLGRFIYVMDAVLDEEKDAKHHSYNPVAAFRRQNGSFESPTVLTMLMADCTSVFEKLPLELDTDLMRNILYSGVWLKWHAAHGQKDRRQEENSND